MATVPAPNIVWTTPLVMPMSQSAVLTNNLSSPATNPPIFGPTQQVIPAPVITQLVPVGGAGYSQ